jgi:hypothetical protein
VAAPPPDGALLALGTPSPFVLYWHAVKHVRVRNHLKGLCGVDSTGVDMPEDFIHHVRVVEYDPKYPHPGAHLCVIEPHPAPGHRLIHAIVTEDAPVKVCHLEEGDLGLTIDLVDSWKGTAAPCYSVRVDLVRPGHFADKHNATEWARSMANDPKGMPPASDEYWSDLSFALFCATGYYVPPGQADRHVRACTGALLSDTH